MKKFAYITGLTALAVTHSSAAILINEFQPNPNGGDPVEQTIELKATGGELSFNGFYGSIEGDVGFAIDRSGAVNVVFDMNGLATFTIPDLENPTFTFFISTSDHSGAAGVGDITTAIDAIGVPDNNGDTLYGVTLGGQDFTNPGVGSTEPVSVFRDGVTNNWYWVSDGGTTDVFDINGNAVAGTQFDNDPTVTPSTFNDPNPAVPEPSSVALLGLGGLAFLIRRKR